MDPISAQNARDIKQLFGLIDNALANISNVRVAFSASKVPKAASLNVGLVAANSTKDSAVTIAGSVVGSPVIVGLPSGTPTTGLAFSAFVYKADGVKLRVVNCSTGAITVGAATYGFAVLPFTA